jgi:hypothetical protein
MPGLRQAVDNWLVLKTADETAIVPHVSCNLRAGNAFHSPVRTLVNETFPFVGEPPKRFVRLAKTFT